MSTEDKPTIPAPASEWEQAFEADLEKLSGGKWAMRPKREESK